MYVALMRTDKLKAKKNRIEHLFWSGVSSLKADGVAVTARRVKGILTMHRNSKFWIYEELFSPEELEAQKKEKFERSIKFSFIVPLYNTDKDNLQEMIDSVLAQTYSNWELCLADGNDKKSTAIEKICTEYTESDNRIKYRRLEKNKGLSGNSNEALAMADGEYISLLSQDDILHPSALHETMLAICEGADFIYTDEAAFDSPDIEDLTGILYKPDFGPDSLRGNNYIGHFTSFKRSLLEESGKFRSEFDGSQEHDLYIRLTGAAQKISHIPEVLYFKRNYAGEDSETIRNKNNNIDAGARAVEDYLRAKGIEAEVEALKKYGPYYRVHYPIIAKPKISIIIPNYEHLGDLKRCIRSIIEKSTYDNYEIVIVENNSKSKEIFDYYEKLTSENENIKVITWERKFNFSAINNYAISEATKGEYLLLLNNDTEIITPEWMEEMLMYAQRGDVGAVGAKMYFPDDDTVQHAGVVLGLGAVAGHVSMTTPREAAGYMGRNIYAQNLSAVTGACMMVRRDVWDEVGGLDEKFAVAYNDVDLCLKIRNAGYLIVWTPFAELYHDESKTRGFNRTHKQLKIHAKEVWMLRERWDDFLEKGDPYYNPNFTLERPDYTPKAYMDYIYGIKKKR